VRNVEMRENHKQ